jgi:integrase/recombinase XerD
MSALAPTLQAFFSERLIDQRHASPNTIAAYRDTFKLLLAFAATQRGRQPSQLDIGDLDATLIGAFLTHLESERGNSIRTRNARLAAIHSLFRYAQHRHPEHAADIQRVLAIPPKRAGRALVTFLEQEETEALLTAPDRSTWTGRRDHALLILALQTGLRVTELTGLNCGDLHLATGAHRHRRRAARLARGARRPPRRAALPDPPRRQAQPRRTRTQTREIRERRDTALPQPA